ncbi:MAG: ELWxxDGT repeat protein [Ginsengibacter sp.]
MKKSLFLALSFIFFGNALAQVTQINANKSLHGVAQINNTLAIFDSGVDSSIWVSDGTKAGTIQISDTIKSIGSGGVLNGKYIFKGLSPHCGMELFITDGTKSGTHILKDINPGMGNSQPQITTIGASYDYIYFAAVTPELGCELWRSDGTPGNTTLVKDIGVSITSGIDSNHFSLGQVGNTFIFTATTPATGNELWQTDGTPGNTSLLKDIDPGIISSNPNLFYPLKNMALFNTKASNGINNEIWRTDGTPGGTVLIKNNIVPGFAPFTFFHVFKDRAYFLINDGVHAGDAMYSTDGVDASTTHTSFLKDLGSPTLFGSGLLANAVNLPDKFIFPYYDLDFMTALTTKNDLYQCDGTATGTKVFKSFSLDNTNFPLIYTSISFDIVTKTINYPLFKGNFYFAADDSIHGNELWLSDGNNTNILKDINPGPEDGITSGSFLFASSDLFFAANDGVHGNELWRTNGTQAGTSMVQDIFPGNHNADPSLQFINNGKIFFGATDASPADSSVTDLYVVDGIFSSLPVGLLDFTVTTKGADAILHWTTSQEINSRDFTIQSSDDAQHWNNIGTITAAGNSSVQKNYTFSDLGVMNSGKSVVYYRLTQSNRDGKNIYSNVIFIKLNSTNQWNVQMLSNPLFNKVELILSGVKGEANIFVNNINGQVIYKKQIQNQNGFMTLPVNLPGGVYFLVVTNNNEIKTIKFVKN